MKDMLHMGLFLFVIAAVAGVLLAYTESVTAPLILENQRKAEELARREVLPNAEKFNESQFADAAASQTYSYSTGLTSNGEVAGVVIKVAPKGYAGPIEMVVGIDKSGKINGYKILTQKETPGLGTKLSEPVFAEPFKKLISEKATPVLLVKKDGGDVDGITAATISSRAFCKGVNEALDLFKKVQPQLTAIPQALTLPATPADTVSQTSITGGNQ
ncbi:MAG TPA: RnfABCDGE type electron transport complex subunit G [Candidatus Rifleibacterium sp.]|nr:RnfABCDGE type electron transport complex subunit G [Candidatus Rifleibacterium sp.]